MINILELSTETCLVVQFSAKLSGSEYQHFLDALDERLEKAATVSLVIEFSEFEFYSDMEAARKDLKFGFGEYRKIKRAAFVGDQKWIEWFTRLVGPFTHAEERPFPAGQIQEAFNWASS